MSTPPPAQPKSDAQLKPAASPKAGGTRPIARRAAALPAKPRLDYRLPVAAGIISLILGIILGVVVMRHRQSATEVVASVNGTVISKDDFFEKLQSFHGQAVVHKMVEENLQLQFADKKGVKITDADVDVQLARDQRNPEFQKLLLASGLTLAAYRDAIRLRLTQSKVYSQGVTVSDAEVRDFYSYSINPAHRNPAYYTPETVSLSVISVPNVPNVAPAQNVMNKVMMELKSGTAFSQVATIYSTDESASKGGAIDPLVRGRNPLSESPQLESTLFNLPVGGMSKVVEFKNLHWIFYCNSKTPSQTLPFSAVETEVRQNALFAKGFKINSKTIAKDFADFQKSSKLKAFWPQYEHAVTGH